MSGLYKRLGDIGFGAFLAAFLAFLFYRTVIAPKEPTLALTTWAVTLGVFVFSVFRFVVANRRASLADRANAVLTRSNSIYLPLLGSFVTLLTLNALHAAPLGSKTLNDQPDMLLPLLAVHVFFCGLIFKGIYYGENALTLGVLITMSFIFPIYGGASLIGYGSILVLFLHLKRDLISIGEYFCFNPNIIKIPHGINCFKIFRKTL